MTKAELIAEIAKNAEITKTKSDEILGLLIQTMTNELKQNGTITLTGLGSFTVVERKARRGHNPRTKEPIQIPASNAIRFKTAKALKDAVN